MPSGGLPLGCPPFGRIPPPAGVEPGPPCPWGAPPPGLIAPSPPSPPDPVPLGVVSRRRSSGRALGLGSKGLPLFWAGLCNARLT